MNKKVIDFSNVNKINFGSLIKSGRKSKGYSQEKLAEILGVTGKSIGCIERGECYPSPENIFKLAKILDISLDEYVFSFKRFDDTLCFSELNEMLKDLSADQKAVVISVIEAMCRVLTLQNDKN